MTFDSPIMYHFLPLVCLFNGL